LFSWVPAFAGTSGRSASLKTKATELSSGRFDEAPLRRFAKKPQAYDLVFFLAFFFFAMIALPWCVMNLR
jgi:hypothetical protein